MADPPAKDRIRRLTPVGEKPRAEPWEEGRKAAPGRQKEWRERAPRDAGRDQRPMREGGEQRGPPAESAGRPPRPGPPRGEGRRPERADRRGPRHERPRQEIDPVAETMAPEPLPVLAKKERKMRLLKSARADAAYGKAPSERSVDELLRYGVIILDKPPGPTSHQVVAWVRSMLGIAKIGHGGTLDPKVSGVLPTLLGEATKIVKPLQGIGKEYIVTMRLHGDVPEADIRKEARRFIGKIRQIPPLRSAVARRLRTRRVYDLEVLQVAGRDVLMRVTCEGGFYVRNLCVDLGRSLGTRGHMTELRRTRTGLFHESEAVTLHDLLDAVRFWKDERDEGPIRRCIHPFERAIAHLPRVIVRDSAVDAVCHGADLAMPGVVAMEEGIAVDDAVGVFTMKGEAVAIGTARMSTADAATADSGVVVDPSRVLMLPGVYPMVWKGRTGTVEEIR